MNNTLSKGRTGEPYKINATQKYTLDDLSISVIASLRNAQKKLPLYECNFSD